jgi:midasin (ATPase involved in ribosome maturation)
MDHIPFDYYVVVHDVLSLPEILGDSLRQWWQSMGEN